MKKLSILLGAVVFMAADVSAAPILVLGPGPTSAFTGTVINFDGQAEGSIITNQFAGVIFSQTGGGAPQIDNSPFLFAYDSNSGIGTLTGSAQGGNVPTTAGIIADFGSGQGQAGAFLSDTAPLGNYLVQAFGAGNVFLESILVPAASLPGAAAGCDLSSPFETSGLRCGVFVGFIRPGNDIRRIQFGPSSAAAGSDAFAIDDLTFAAAVPEPATLTLLGTGLLVGGWRARRLVGRGTARH